MYPEIKKFSLIDEKVSASITSSDTIPAQHYFHIVEKWKCLDCKHEGDDEPDKIEVIGNIYDNNNLINK